MAKDDTQEQSNAPIANGVSLAGAAKVVDAEPKEFPLSLDEFCARISMIDKRVELIGGFNHSEKAAGRNKDTETAYRKRYAEFINQPA